MKVKVDIFSGFLGAGKTRLIKKMLKENYYNEKVAIVENEFGEVSIDGEVLKRTNTVVKEINAGCICCQVTGDFKDSINEIIENCDVERLIIEPTGVAKLSDIKKVLNEEELKKSLEIDKVITVVDAEKYNLYLSNFRNFFIDQIKSAEFIIFSRYQNISEEDRVKLKESIEKLNSAAKVVGCDWDKSTCDEIIPEFIFTKLKVNNKKNTLGRISSRGVKLSKSEKANITFETFAVNISKNFSKEELISKFRFIDCNEAYGEIVRAKGIVQVNRGEMQQFNYTLSEINMEEIKYNGDGVISFIGINLNREEITKFFI